MTYSLQSLSSATVDSTACLHVSVNTERYQFDAPEGAQRTIVQGKARLRNLNTIFLTSLRPEDMGGLSGMIFTLADRGSRKITIIGPENTGALIATMRHFLTRCVDSRSGRRLHADTRTNARTHRIAYLTLARPLSDEIELVVIERSMVPGYNESKPIFKNDTIQVWSVAAVPTSASSSATDGQVGGSEAAVAQTVGSATEGAAEAAPTVAAAEAASVEAESEAAAGKDATALLTLDEPELSSSSTGSDDKKRKRSPSPPPTFAGPADLPLFRPQGPPTPTEAAQPYYRLHPAHSANGTRALLLNMFKSVTITAMRPPELPLLGAGTVAHAYSPTDVMPALARADNDVRLSYILLGPEKRGHVDVSKSDALGVPRKRLAELTSGKKIHVTDPTTGAEIEVRPEQILGSGIKPSATVVVHCPSEAYIDSLVETAMWRRWYGNDDDEVRPVHVMWHKAGVWPDARYQAWMAKFGRDVVVRRLAAGTAVSTPDERLLTARSAPPIIQHLSGDPELANNHLNTLSSAISTTSLSLIDPTVFKRMHCGSQAPHKPTGDVVKVWPIVPLQKIDILPGPRRLPVVGPMAFSGGFRDALGLGIEQIAGLSEQELFDRLDKTIPTFTAEVRKARAKVAELAQTKGERQPGDDVVVTALGTGSSMPSKYRNGEPDRRLLRQSPTRRSG